jgi:hypothetical protein
MGEQMQNNFNISIFVSFNKHEYEYQPQNILD